AFEAWTGGTSSYYPHFLMSVCEHFNIPQIVPVEDLPAEHMNKLLQGTGTEIVRLRYDYDFGQRKEAMVTFEGIVNNL
ncbi:hypothetical protein B2I21_00245, partial [Chryseobacterium mucoviscidosis]